MDPTVFGRLRLIWEWYNWGVFVAFVLALAAVFWVFFDAQRRGRESILWKVVAVVCLILIIPSVILRIDPSLSLNVLGAIEPLAWLGIIAGVFALITIFAYSLGVAVTPAALEVAPMPPSALPPTVAAPPPPPPPPPTVPEPPPLAPTELPRSPGWAEPVPPAGAPAPAKTELLRKEPAQLAWLVQRSGARQGKEFRLGETTNVGRDASQSDIVIDDSTVSRQHARVRLENARFVLYDLASSNGTFVNGQQVQKQPLLDGDQVRFGSVEFAFMEVRQPQG